jgi:subtilisin family serine protease
MKHCIFLLVFLFPIALCAAVPSAVDHVPGQVLVLLEPGKSIESISIVLNKAVGAQVEWVKPLSESMNIWLIQFPTTIEDDVILQAASRQKGVLISQFNHTNLEVRSLPNDSLFFKQWALLNDGINGGSGTADIDAESAWDISTGGLTPFGDTIVVAVIDMGFDLDHVDLVENMFYNYNEIDGNGIDDDGNGYIDDVQGWDFYNNDPVQPTNNHGTHVAGTIGARGNNNIGVTGVNWNVKILPITGSSTLESTVVQSYAYVHGMRKLYNETGGQKGAYIVATNSSFGVNNGQPAEYPLWCAMYDSLGYQGVLSAGATANDDIDVDEVGDVPTACESDFLISVTNTRSTDVLNNNAGFGVETIDLGAPGSGVYSTYGNDVYGTSTGTSMATPHVAGAIGLMYSAICSETFADGYSNPAQLALLFKEKMLTEGVDEISSLDGLVSSGGRLNLYKSVLSVSTLCVNVVFNSVEPECDSCNGQLVASILGAETPYTMKWSNGSTDDTISNLCAGIYSITVFESGGDSTLASYALSNASGPEIQITTVDVSCKDQSDGEISASGGVNYLWENASTSNVRSNLEAGLYYLLATDSAQLCTTAVEVRVNSPDSIDVEFSFVEPSDSTSNDGEISVSVTGGTPPYSIVWENGDTTLTSTGLSHGLYGLTVTDNNGCVISETGRLGFPVGIPESVSTWFSVWPNPTKGTINLSSSSSISRINVIDALGRDCFEKQSAGNSAEIDLTFLRPGIYFLVILNEEGQRTEKIIRSNAE